MTDENPYTPPKIWTWNKESGGQFANINRPIAGPTHDKAKPEGRHPLTQDVVVGEVLGQRFETATAFKGETVQRHRAAKTVLSAQSPGQQCPGQKAVIDLRRPQKR